MNLIDRAFLLKKTIIFQSLDMDLLLTIADKTETIICKPGSSIFSIGQPGFSFYIIVEGYVTISKEELDPPLNLKPLDCFGEESLFNNKLREYNASANTQVRILVLSKGQILNIVEECPSVALSFLELYAKQLGFRQP
ncbi:MlotiK1 channel,Predicted signal-transduction protein containing cAMP-binding and CBS domains,Cyclic nucleotide-binding domain [Chlamydia serpentis]|uniref:MlotiK1 channel,Predicted signal-transduction protein containing cAMP-binding and CBS domains,Cyclic nucleotide-binding domain n=1 Tax=Chlamydia serpentis TaxID=1967782 RepID=A0A2R8FAI9_9CHLA|nr:cyclic nucleotide-binding domain-containing protein [Chlamydia serpentis]SPN73438.1 MlotiK1 channel,Predicted signal-transduction protein containing cAMP-binding and CBS domains,Cyclic nucleotide-binding domain [Chlamydia serpentis]